MVIAEPSTLSYPFVIHAYETNQEIPKNEEKSELKSLTSQRRRRTCRISHAQKIGDSTAASLTTTSDLKHS